MKQKFDRLTNFLLSLAVIIIVFGIGYKIGQYKEKNFPGQSTTNQIASKVDLALFWDTWSKLKEKYTDNKKINDQNMVYGAIKGMVASVDDPYTFFLTPNENKQSKDDLGGKLEGIGAQLGLKNNKIVVIAPLSQSPAEKAGVRAGDYINKVDGVSTSTWTLSQAVSKIRGKKGTPVKLTLQRNDKEFEITIVRAELTIASVELSFSDPVAIIKVNQFGDNTNSEWDKAVSQVYTKWKNKQIKGLVLDLRGNPGGYLESSVYIASEFLPLNSVVVKQESRVYGNHSYFVEREGKLLDIPLVVLIDQGSASASEILSGSLRDHKRATLIGEKSFGKGSVQEPIDLGQGAGLHVTIAKWILPNGAWINGTGIEPDIKIENKITEGNTITKETDLQLKTAIEKAAK